MITLKNINCLFILGTVMPFSCQHDLPERNNLPNIVIIFADDMGYGDVSYLNPEAKVTTPAIDNLAKSGITFIHAHAGASVSIPSRYGLLTGRYAFRSNYKNSAPYGYLSPRIEPDRETIASMLKKKGYSTAVVGKWHQGLIWPTKDGYGNVKFDKETRRTNIEFNKPVLGGPNDYGFDYSFIHPASLDMPPYMFLRNGQVIDPEIKTTEDIYSNNLKNTIFDWDYKKVDKKDVYWGRGIWWRRGEISNSFRLEKCLPTILNEGVSFIEKHVQNSPKHPFFLYLSLTGPHTPWLPSNDFQGKTPIEYYGDFILEIDNVVSQVSQTLKKLNIYKNTILIFASDNGSPWPQQDIDRYKYNPNQGRRGQKGDVWDGGHHIPLIISWPSKIQNAGTYGQLISLTDLFATFSELTGQKLSDDTAEDSFSFLQVLEGDNDKIIRPESMMIHHSLRGMYGIRKDGWKFINGLGSGGFTVPAFIKPNPGEPKGQLYYISEDSLESINVIQKYEQIANKLKIELDSVVNQGYSRLK